MCDGYLVAALCGELDTVDAADVAAALAVLTARGRCLIVDMAALDFIDCSALGALLGVQILARQDGGDMVLAGPREHVRRILALTSLDDAFCVHGSVACAVASLASAAATRCATACGEHLHSLARQHRCALVNG